MKGQKNEKPAKVTPDYGTDKKILFRGRSLFRGPGGIGFLGRGMEFLTLPTGGIQNS